MIDPAEALGIGAQVAITLAGFAGVVVVFGSSAVHQWSPVDRFRLRLMLLGSSLALSLCLLGMLLLAAELAPPLAWRASSLAVASLLLPGLIGNLVTFRRFPADELERTGASPAIFYASSALGFAVVALELGNAALLAAFWPFFLAIVLSLLISMLQFVRLILARRD